MRDSLSTGKFKSTMFVFQSTYETEHITDLQLLESMKHPIAFLSEMQGDTMYFHQAMAQRDSGEFVNALEREINCHVTSEH